MSKKGMREHLYDEVGAAQRASAEAERAEEERKQRAEDALKRVRQHAKPAASDRHYRASFDLTVEEKFGWSLPPLATPRK